MARPNMQLIWALRKTSARIRQGVKYQWGHLGACNCGHLAQTLTERTKREIHEAALERVGDWGEVSKNYCETSGMRIDTIIAEMLSAGLKIEDIEHLENLSDPRVLKTLTLPGERKYLKHNDRDDLVTYLDAWADLLENELPRAPEPELEPDPEPESLDILPEPAADWKVA